VGGKDAPDAAAGGKDPKDIVAALDAAGGADLAGGKDAAGGKDGKAPGSDYTTGDGKVGKVCSLYTIFSKRKVIFDLKSNWICKILHNFFKSVLNPNLDGNLQKRAQAVHVDF
jgi:hypothetical protein